MKTFRERFDFITVIKYGIIFFSFLLFNRLESKVMPYSSAILITAMAQGASVFFTSILYLLSFLALGEVGLLGSSAIAASIYAIIIFIYRKFNTKMKYELVAYALLGLIGFLFLGNTKTQISLNKRILTVILTVLLSFLCHLSGKAIAEKGLKFKLGFEEFTSLAVVTAVCGLGICNFISPYFWKGLSVVIILITAYIYRLGTGTIISAVLGLSFSVYYQDITFVSVFLVWSIAATSIMPVSRHASAILILVTDYVIQTIFNVYSVYLLADFISLLIGVTLFCLIPTKSLKKLKERLYSFREKQLVRQSINRNRTMLAGRLYDLSGVFTEMANAFNLFQKKDESEDSAKSAIKKEICVTVCRECSNYSKCSKNQKSLDEGFYKMIDIGFAKGKLSLIDMPKELGERCIHPNNILYGINKLLADYRARLIENANIKSGRDLIASEALGVAEILRGLALESGTLLKYQSRLERELSENLFKAGILVSELLIYREEERIAVSLITVMKEFSVTLTQKVISKTLGTEMMLYEKASISEDKCYLSFKKATEYDAVFGIANAVKDGSTQSGDTHSVLRIGTDRFLVALSDGMGSGKQAESVSSASLSLIESFYKAGLKSDLILRTVNRLLSINTEDSFTALDVSVIDLKTCSADFIKYGAPYGFIINDNGIKIVEGNSLPLGIIDELKPSVANTQLEGGDMILLLTDGISDAFGSSGEVIDFLRTVPAKNPQTLANDVLEKAVSLNGGKHNDDMTALAVRVYKRTCA